MLVTVETSDFQCWFESGLLAVDKDDDQGG